MLKKIKFRSSPFNLLVLLVITVAVIEALVMMLLPRLLPMSSTTDTALDIVLLATLLFAVLYYFVFRPMSQTIAKLNKAQEMIQAESKKYQALLQTAGDGLHVLDLDGNVLQANDAFCNMLGYSPDEMRDMNVAQWDAQWSSAELKQKIHDLIGHSVTFESSHCRRDGSIIDVEINVVGVEAAGKQMVFCAARDITARKVVEARQQLAANVFTHAREGITIADLDGRIIDVNETFTRITGYSREEVLGKNPRILKSGLQGSDFYAEMWQTLAKDGYWIGEVWNRRKTGEVYAELLTISAVRDTTGKTQHYVALFTDITSMKEHQQQLENIAHYDALTGLPNRVLLSDRLQQAMSHAMRRAQSLAVVYLDLDGFKAVNDHHGHSIGDELLITVAHRMKEALREGDTLARIGGDEFVAVLVDLERPQDCEPILARLLQAAADQVLVNDAVLQVSASIGVTLYPQDEADADQLMRHADQAMYQAKLAGKNRYHLFDVEHDRVVQTQRETLQNIRRAIEQNEFVLHYQPKVNMKTGEVVGAEALIRWQHPERGLLPPAAFLPIIENHPVSVELDQWVIDTALTQMSEWHAAKLDIPVSVNIGALQLQQSDFEARLAALLAAHPDIRPSCLELEVLETSALDDMTKASEIMHACRRIGVRFALDDFGTGYSSLTYLKRLPADALKIDQSFVNGMLDDTDDLSIVEGVIGLAATFLRTVIAEGVETVSHGELLLLLGCELAQGYAIARPMPGPDLPGWVKTWRPHEAWRAWHRRTMSHDEQMLVFAEVKHRQWLRDIETYLLGDRDAPPPMDEKECRFGSWQVTDGHSRYGEHPEFQTLVAMHDRVHVLGRELVELYASGRKIEVQSRLGELHVLRDELIARLRTLSWMSVEAER